MEIDIEPPSKPIINHLTPNNDNKPKWEWTSSEDAVDYGIKLNANPEIISTETTFTSPIALNDGEHYLRVRSRDAQGNWSDFAENRIIIDKTPPAEPVVFGNSPTGLLRPVWTWNKEDDVVLFNIRLNNNSITPTADISFTPTDDLPEGTHTLYVSAIDQYGNESNFASHEIVIDKTPPDAPEPYSETPTTNKIPTWTWNAVTDAVAYGVILNNSTEIFITTNSYTAPSPLPDGDNVIQVRSQDSVGNVSVYKTHTVKIDTEAPVVPNVTSDVDKTSSQRPTWRWNSITDAVVFEWELHNITESGEFLSKTMQGSTGINTFTPNQDLPTGFYKLIVFAIDSLGNKSDEGSFVIQVDATAPETPIITAPAQTRNRKPVWTYSSVSDDVVEYEVKSEDESEYRTTNTSYQPQTDLENGNYTLKVSAFDGFGNKSETSEKQVNVYCIPSSYNTIQIPTNSSGKYVATTESVSFTIFAMMQNDLFGFDTSNFISSGVSTFIDAYLPDVSWIGFSFGSLRPAIGSCVYMQRDNICYWGKVSQTDQGVTFIAFNNIFNGTCE